MRLVVLELFSSLWGIVFEPFASKRWNLCEKSKISWYVVDHCSSAKFNNWKLTTSLLLWLVIHEMFVKWYMKWKVYSYFCMKIMQFSVDNIFVQRTELWLIFKTIWFNGGYNFSIVLPTTAFYKILRYYARSGWRKGVFAGEYVKMVVYVFN